MRTIPMNKGRIVLYAIVFFLFYPVALPEASASLFHATSKAAARRIIRKGFSRAKMRASARFGKGIYVSTRKKTALREARKVGAVIKFKGTKYLRRNTIDLSKPTPSRLRRLTGSRDLRGSVKRGIIGPKLGRRLGRVTGKKGKAIRFRSVKVPKESNIFIPRKVYKAHPRIIRPYKVLIRPES